jgi:beta-lactamase class D
LIPSLTFAKILLVKKPILYFVWPIAYCLLLVASCTPNNVTIDNSIKKYFDENKVKGSFALLNNGTNLFTVYNLKGYFDSSYSPGTGFEIFIALTGLQTGKISNDSMKINVGDKEISMFEAFRNSSVPYFQEAARRIGKPEMQRWLDSVYLKSITIKTSVDSFWLDNSVKLTPDQQLGLVRKLYFNRLPFYETYQKILQSAMLMESNSNYKLSYKFGSGQKPTGDSNGWMMGWIEENRHPYFFVLYFETGDKNQNLQATGNKMLKDILKQQGFFEGKM